MNPLAEIACRLGGVFFAASVPALTAYSLGPVRGAVLQDGGHDLARSAIVWLSKLSYTERTLLNVF